ncbi:hypothetical protein BH09PAT2_BH09PAT2_07720 [soil metagenome]
MEKDKTKNIWVLLRFTMAFIMLWAFFDKTFGLGFATPPEKSWLNGSSPTFGFLTFGTNGIFSSVFKNLAGNLIIDWLFMLGLLLIGLSLLLGVGLKIAGYSGALFMFFLYLAVVPSANNPIIDEHIVYILIFLGLRNSEAGNILGLGNFWRKTSLIKHYPFLQ